MEHVQLFPFLQLPPDILQVVRKDINMEKPGEMKEAVRILDEWVKQQPHFLEKNIPSHYLEMTVVGSKGSLERAKRIITRMFTVRTLKPQDFMPCNPREYYEIFKEHASVVATHKLSSEYYRIAFVKLRGKVTNDIMDAIYRFSFGTVDYLKAHDYHKGGVLVLDLVDADMQHFVTHINLLEFKNCIFTMLNAFGIRLKRFHPVSSSKAIQVLVSLFGPLLGKKFMDRMVLNTSVEELAQYYNKDAF